ncbi:glycoside hydrolase family 24 protein [Burkholderia anthina]|nr:glycoside hydrolase family 104 protein [Burkholderia anthina]
MLLAASAVALLYLSEQGDQDVASFTPGDIIGSATGDLLDMTGTYTGGDPNQNRQAFLDMIAQSEIGAALLAETDNGYNVLVGATPANPLTFSDYSQHPRIYNAKFNSTAAGRYQINWPTYQTVSRQTGLTDFSPDTQDAMALQLCSNKGALDDIDAGNIQAAIAKCAPVWASLAGAGYGQHENSMTNLVAWFTNAGGVTA